ncbi:excinuclease ABC subunit UvrC [uncultured Helicobacter sp.]|uniref:excinuclease ABC subunit UvrC n=1 Tax=uncultured Helicobacter sp. TaxID=175537 RepID=UPI0026178BD3|nr:excinuclease ABC subunit UvrC [uncultured Helicobacter sp.]
MPPENPSLLFTLKHLPTQSGIYQYFDNAGNLLYIGKAKHLRNRIKSYFSIHNESISPKPNLSPRIGLMVSQIAQIHTLLTNNEQDALILENSLIKSLKPKYNILLRDDKTYPYIYIDKSLPYPRFDITRQVLKSPKIQYFGPFASGARELLDSLYDVLPLVQKKSCVKGKKACMFYAINKCLAPCEGKISTIEYAKLITQGIALLENKKELARILESKMQKLSTSLQFEEAAKIRDRIRKITQMKNQSIIDIRSGNYDVFTLVKDDESLNTHILMVLFIRNGRIVSSDFSLLHQDIYDDNLPELYTQALLNHYKNITPLMPDEILIPHFAFADLVHLQQLISSQTQSHIKIIQPQKGKKRELLTLAYQNALEILRLHKQQHSDEPTLIALKELCALQRVPYRIEVFDTSHHSGVHNVGGMIVYENNAFLSSHYRRYTLEGSDEYTQMRQMLERRAAKFESNPPPDLWLLDGGKAQIHIACEILQSVGANVDVVAIAKMKHNAKAYRAKGNALDILRTNQAEFKLKANDKRLQFCQKLRDEAHKYAITYHRYRKTKDTNKVQIMGEKQYSKAQIKRLLEYFGSFQTLQNASQEQIQSVLKADNSTLKNPYE